MDPAVCAQVILLHVPPLALGVRHSIKKWRVVVAPALGGVLVAGKFFHATCA